MYAIDKEKFGTFVAQLRRETNMTQKELAERLYISDKAVSKWERGLSIPDVALLVPLAEQLGVTVTELLECRRIPQEEPMDSEQTEELVQKVIGLTAEESRNNRPGLGWWLLGSIVAGGMELGLMTLAGIPWEEIVASVGIVMLLMAVFGLHFCIFARKQLPKYYDENRITCYSDGILRMNLPGVSFNNSNWPHILRAAQLWCLLGLVLTPALFFLFRSFAPRAWQDSWLFVMLFLTLGGLFIPMVMAAKKYEFGEGRSRSKSGGWKQFVWIPVAAVLAALLLMTGSFSSGSGLRVGWSERKGLDYWSATYMHYDGWRQRTINWDGKAELLYAEIETESGELDLAVTDEAGNTLFFRENIGTDSFEIPISGRCRVRVTADGHKGGIHLVWK